jgi:Ca2+-binding RTX toxin-like protein
MTDLFADRIGLATEGRVHAFDVVTGTEDADTLYGSDGADTVSGLGGDDFIFTGKGFDSIDAGDGDDEIYVGDAGDTVHCGAGQDFIEVTVLVAGSALGGVYSGDADNDHLKVAAVAAVASDSVTLEGGDGDDLLEDLSRGEDRLDGGSGFDLLYGFSRSGYGVTIDLGAGTSEGKLIGSNTLVGIEGYRAGRADDILTGSAAANAFYGRNGTDIISGLEGDDTIFGGGRADTITGGLGGDSLVGGGGRDHFVYLTLADSPNADPDFIDRLKQHDVIDLSAIDADVNTAGDQAFVRVKAFDGHAGQMTLSFSSGHTSVRVDVNGDAVADMTIVIEDNHLTYRDFVL